MADDGEAAAAAHPVGNQRRKLTLNPNPKRCTWQPPKRATCPANSLLCARTDHVRDTANY